MITKACFFVNCLGCFTTPPPHFTTCLHCFLKEVFPVCLYLAGLLFHVAGGKWFLQCGPESVSVCTCVFVFKQPSVLQVILVVPRSFIRNESFHACCQSGMMFLKPFNPLSTPGPLHRHTRLDFTFESITERTRFTDPHQVRRLLSACILSRI